MEIHKEINAVFMTINATPIPQPIHQGVILTFKSSSLRNTFHKAIAAINSDFSDGYEQRKLKTLWKGVTILGCTKNIHDSWEEIKTSTLPGVWKKLIRTLMPDLEGSALQRKNNCRRGGTSKRTRIRSGAWRCDWNMPHLIELDKTWIDEELFLRDEQRKQFIEMWSTSGEEFLNDKKGFRKSYKLSWWSRSRV